MKRKTPSTLGKAGVAYWKAVCTEFDLGDDDKTLLESACIMLDRAAAARAIIDKDGVIIEDRFEQKKPHPAIDIERQSQLAFVRIRRELGLDIEPPDSRPPLPRGYR